MKKTILLFIQFSFFTLIANAQQNKNTRYFDVEHKEITEKEFKKRYTNKVLDIVGDSVNHKKLINREESGSIENRSKLIAALEKASNQTIDSTKTLIIIYYPGQDPCNTGGAASTLTAKYKETETSAKQIAKSQTIYIYKDFKGLEKYGNSIHWVKDPGSLVEQLFFKHHYPCGSFVVVSKTGAYISYFGEYPPYFILNAVTLLNKK